MANAKISFRIFDTGLFTYQNMTSLNNQLGFGGEAHEFLSTINNITVSAALDPNTKMALMFGTDNYYGDWSFNNVRTVKCHFGSTNHVSTQNDGVNSNVAFIGCRGSFVNLYSDNFCSVSVDNTFDLNKIHTIETDAPFSNDVLTNLRYINSQIQSNSSNLSTVDKNIVEVLYKTFFNFNESNSSNFNDEIPCFIPVNGYDYDLTRLNQENRLTDDGGIAAYAEDMSIKIVDLKLFVLLMSIHPNDVSNLPMSTVQSISIY